MTITGREDNAARQPYQAKFYDLLLDWSCCKVDINILRTAFSQNFQDHSFTDRFSIYVIDNIVDLSNLLRINSDNNICIGVTIVTTYSNSIRSTLYSCQVCWTVWRYRFYNNTFCFIQTHSLCSIWDNVGPSNSKPCMFITTVQYELWYDFLYGF